MPVLRSALLSAGTPGYGTLLTLIERAGLYAVIEQASTPDTVRDALLRAEVGDLAIATAEFEALRAAMSARSPELPRSRHVLRYLAAIEVATTPAVLPQAAVVAPVAPSVTTASDPLAGLEALAAAVVEAPLEEASDEEFALAFSADDAFTTAVTPITVDLPMDAAIPAVAVAALPIETVIETPTIVPVILDEETTDIDTAIELPAHLQASQVTPAAAAIEEPVPATETTPAAPAIEPTPDAPVPRLSIDEIIARAFGRRATPALPAVVAGPQPERVTPATISARLGDGAWVSQARYATTAEIAVGTDGVVEVRRGASEGLPIYLPALAGTEAEVALEDGELLLLDLLTIDGRDLRTEALWRRYVVATETADAAGLRVAPLLPHPRGVDAGELIAVRDLRAPYGKPGAWIAAG
jgi:hypothetical protein